MAIRKDKSHHQRPFDDPYRAAVAIENSVDGNDPETREERYQEYLKKAWANIKYRAERGENVGDELLALRISQANNVPLGERVQQAISDHKAEEKRVEKAVKSFDKNKWNGVWNEQIEPESGLGLGASEQSLSQKNTDNAKIQAHQHREKLTQDELVKEVNRRLRDAGIS